jgi:hypothetical protein
VGGKRMNALKDLRINELKDLKFNGLKYLKIEELKHLVHKPGRRDDTGIEDLIKSKKQVETEIRKLFKEKKEIESRIGKIQKTECGESEEISEFPWREEIFPPLRRNMHPQMSELIEIETDALQREDTEISERISSRIEKKVEEADKSPESKETGEIEDTSIEDTSIEDTSIEDISIIEVKVKEEVKSAGEKNDVKNNEEADLNNILKKDREIAFPENTDKIKTADPALKKNEKKGDSTPEKSKTESKKLSAGIFGSSLIEELLESEDLCTEEEQSFMKYIEESNVTELITDLKEVKKLLA